MNYNFRRPIQKAHTIPVASILEETENTTWIDLAVPITFAAAVLTDLPIVLVFGRSNKENISTTDVMVYNATTETWKSVSSLSEARSFAAITAVTKNAVIIVGGFRFHENNYQSV